MVSTAMELAGVPKIFMTARPASKLLSGAYLYGDVGTGKTLAACGAIRAYAERHVIDIEGQQVYYGSRAKFVNATEWFEMLRATYGHRGESEQQLFQQYSTCGLLVLDDLGKGKQTEWTTEKLYMLINRRWEGALPTIITSNMPLDELCSMMPSTDENMASAISSRIGAMCKPYEFKGKDMRASQN